MDDGTYRMTCNFMLYELIWGKESIIPGERESIKFFKKEKNMHT